MNKMRTTGTTWVIWILVIAFGGIWVIQDSGYFDTRAQGLATNIAEVNGTPISYQDYSQALDSQMRSYQAQTGESVPPQLMDLYRDQVYERMIDDIIREDAMDQMGIGISDSEIVDLVMGPNPDPFIQQRFSDGQGGINRQLLMNFVEDESSRDQWIGVEGYLRSKRLNEKLDKLLQSTVRVSDAEIEEQHRMSNLKADAQYVALRYADIADSLVSVGDADLKSFYNTNKDDFKRERSYDVSYVLFSKLPTGADTTRIIGDLNQQRDLFVSTQDDSSFVAGSGSVRPYSDAFFSPSDLDEELSKEIFSDVTPGRVVGPVLAANQYHLVKILDSQASENPSINARHILFGIAEDAPVADHTAKRQEALDVKRRLQSGEDFVTLARQFSTDTASLQKDGGLGWFGKGRMVAPFEEAAFAASKGNLVGPVKTQFGYHLIEILEKSTTEVKIADIAYDVEAGPATVRERETQADDFKYYSEENGWQTEVDKSADLNSASVAIQKDMQFIPGIGNSRTLLDFLSKSEEGEVSDVIELNDNYIVAKVDGITPEGFRPFEDVREELLPRVTIEKKKEVQRSKLRDAIAANGNLDDIAKALNQVKRTASQVSFDNSLIPNLGREPIVVGTALGLEENGMSEIIDGENSVVVLQVVKKYLPSTESLTESKKQELKRDLLQRKKQDVTTKWLNTLKENAVIDDNRRRFIQ